MHITSLPSPYGIGNIGRSAYEFIDFLASSGQRVWQLLPLCPTSFGDSPYQSPCSFGGNPYFISLRTLAEEGLLYSEELPVGEWGDRVDYKRLYEERYPLLWKAYGRFSERPAPEDYGIFLAENCSWLEDYALYMAIKGYFGGKPWYEWDYEIKIGNPSAKEVMHEKLLQEVDFWRFCFSFHC